MKRTRNPHKNAYFTAGVLSIAGCFLMVTFPEITMTGARMGIDLFVGSVLPTLFPFFVMVNFMVSLGIPERIGRFFERPIGRIYGCDGLGAVICVLSIFSGYPMAAKLVGEYCRKGRLSSGEGKRILSFSCVSGPLFIVGTVGTAMLGNPLYGYVIALGHYLAAFLNGLLFCRVLPVCEPSVSVKKRPYSTDRSRFGVGDVSPWDGRKALSELLSSAIISAFRSLLQICGFIILFSILSEFLQFWGVLRYLPHRWNGALVKGMLEMTTGCDSAAKLMEVTGAFRMALCAGILSFGGLSIAGQSLSMLNGSNIKGGFYVYMKICHGCLAFVLTMGLVMTAQQLGWLDVTAGLVYGSEREVIRVLGGIHSLVFSIRSVIVVSCLMGMVVVSERVIRRMFRWIRTLKHKREENL